MFYPDSVVVMQLWFSLDIWWVPGISSQISGARVNSGLNLCNALLNTSLKNWNSGIEIFEKVMVYVNSQED
ncbi:MAG: hypothetical protein CMN77_00845 [Spirochaetaceae bacterium]|nr:hypothetical protein [Spirochaetaceae bacterium]|tara:strand:+ start:29628 stop:29840 length:213 start_codon:yes stop_codon:yes gene_type:complete